MYVAMHFAAAAQVLLRLKIRDQKSEIRGQFTQLSLACLELISDL
jgi:hypothetical protein